MSFNNLSGRIPSSTQLQSFESSRYNGNVGLCGPPITNNCSENEEVEVPHNPVEYENNAEEIEQLRRWFYIGGGTGFVVGFWVACGALLVKPLWKTCFFSLS